MHLVFVACGGVGDAEVLVHDRMPLAFAGYVAEYSSVVCGSWFHGYILLGLG